MEEQDICFCCHELTNNLDISCAAPVVTMQHFGEKMDNQILIRPEKGCKQRVHLVCRDTWHKKQQKSLKCACGGDFGPYIPTRSSFEAKSLISFFGHLFFRRILPNERINIPWNVLMAIATISCGTAITFKHSFLDNVLRFTFFLILLVNLLLLLLKSDFVANKISQALEGYSGPLEYRSNIEKYICSIISGNRESKYLLEVKEENKENNGFFTLIYDLLTLLLTIIGAH